MSDGFDRVVPSPSWGLLCFALPGNFNVYLERIEVQREKLALSFHLQRQMGEKDRCAVWGCDNDRRKKNK